MHILKNPQKWYKWKLTRIYCSEAILFLFDIGVIEARGLTYKVIIEFLETNMYCSSEKKTVIFRYAARMMRYFGKEGVCTDSFAMLLDRQIYPMSEVWKIFLYLIRTRFYRRIIDYIEIGEKDVYGNRDVEIHWNIEFFGYGP